MTMNPEIKTQWLDALRSGRYEQGKETLHNITDQTYCCLGVLCDLAVKAGIIEPPMVEDHDSYTSLNHKVTKQIARYGDPDQSDTSVEQLPKAVAIWAGLVSDGYLEPIVDTNPAVTVENFDDDEGHYTHEESLAEINDGGSDFIEIAGLIEEHL